jgi:hypothetical protein
MFPGAFKTCRDAKHRDAGGLHSDNSMVEKDVRVVTSVTFFLTD